MKHFDMCRFDADAKMADDGFFGRDDASAAATVQRYYRGMQGRDAAEDQLLAKTFCDLDESEEWHTVDRMRRMEKLREALEAEGESGGLTPLPPPPDAPPVPLAMPCPTRESIESMVAGFEKRRHLPIGDVTELLQAGAVVMAALPSVVPLEPAEGSRVVVVGDLHGQLGDLLHILRTHGMPSEETVYLFNGDFVDRGPNSCEIVLLLLALKLESPLYVHMNRGNHEERSINVFYGFLDECLSKYDHQTFELFHSVFDWLPLAHVINGKVAVWHAGLFGEKDVLISEIEALKRGPEVLRHKERTHRERHLVEALVHTYIRIPAVHSLSKPSSAAGC